MAEPLSGVVYLDNAASAPLRPQVAAAMAPWLSARGVGNPHAGHRAGRAAADAVARAQCQVAALLGRRPAEVVFTSGATEANNTALTGGFCGGGRVIVSAIEHPSVLVTADALEKHGVAVTRVGVTADGVVDLAALEAALADAPAGSLVSVMAVNNETGVIQPIAEVAALARGAGASVHCDAVQRLATGAVDANADLLSLSGHKLGGPMGIGALIVREGFDLVPMHRGGAQQYGLRAGTVPVALAVGLGAACAAIAEQRAAEAARLADLDARLWAGLAPLGAERNGGETAPGLVNATFAGLDAAVILTGCPRLAASTGSACATGRPGPSHVLMAMGLTPEQAHGSVRLSLGWHNTAADVDSAVGQIGAWLGGR